MFMANLIKQSTNATSRVWIQIYTGKTVEMGSRIGAYFIITCPGSHRDSSQNNSISFKNVLVSEKT